MRLVVKAFSISIDGFGAGPDQSLDNPLGVGGPELFDWFFHTRTWNQMHGNPDGETGIDDDLAARAFDNIGAWILGRNMFGPVRGVTGGIEAALEQAKAAAKGKDVRVGGGVWTIRQYLRALGYECVEHIAGGRAAAHVILRKR